MVPSTEILIGDPGGQHLLIRPLSRNHPGLFDRGDANWIDCELQIVAGGFRGAFRSNLRSEEFRTFLDELEGLSRTLQGTASFAAMERQLALSLSGDGKGHVGSAGSD